ncbi:MAG: leucyl/phenylalanyl-tRNA--protein transferase [Bosea sp.]|jgi:leucyl/phenylalanyl-tRNA--protein transferase|nr:leucyl/phenylalanyl-tRNA--protein transferase [Bosea sp. (in: a-proteobacteria)]
MSVKVTPDIVLHAYAAGMFPMSEGADDPGLFWVDPEIRGIMPLDDFHVPRRLARTVRQDIYEIRSDTDFAGVIAGCAAAKAGRGETWINGRIRALYGELFRRGYVHTVEAWSGGMLVGGLYGVSLGRAFFGESMFHLQTDASKVALVHLVARLIRGGYMLLDTQFQTAHLSQFGTREVGRADYQAALALAIESGWGDWAAAGVGLGGAEALRAIDDNRAKR